MLALFGRGIVGLDFEWRRLASWRPTSLIKQTAAVLWDRRFLMHPNVRVGPSLCKNERSEAESVCHGKGY